MQTLKINVGSTTVAEAQELRTVNHSGQILPAAQAFVSALTSADEDQLGDTRMLTFDTDSSFWVCDNSATGNICNEIKHYHESSFPRSTALVRQQAPALQNSWVQSFFGLQTIKAFNTQSR